MSLMTHAIEEELKGVEAIQFLLSLTGNKEPKWVSLKNWRSFSKLERKITLDTYEKFIKEEQDAKEKEFDSIPIPGEEKFQAPKAQNND